MYSKAQFFGDFIKAYGYLVPANFLRGKLTDTASRYIDHCYGVYQNSATNPLGSLGVGRIVRKDERPLERFLAHGWHPRSARLLRGVASNRGQHHR